MPPVVYLFGFILQFIGLYLVILARVYLNGYWGPQIYNYPADAKHLERRGPYKYGRHPVYFGQILLVLGSVLIVNDTIFDMYMFIVLYLNISRAVEEEKQLLKMFGNEYEEYKQETGFFIGLRNFI